jgi:oligopeptide/dipeptide ABC transporter ATP-binding protein
MYLGKIVELAAKQALFRSPSHPYTRALLSAIPGPNPYSSGQRIVLQGDVPGASFAGAAEPPAGCRFHPRCPLAMGRCAHEEPPLIEVSAEHWAACWLA